MTFKKFLWAALLSQPAIFGSASAQTSPYPSKPITIMVGYSAGGGVDTVTRLYATKLGDMLKVPIVVENRPGGSELIAAMPVSQAKPDGYTLWRTTASSLARAPGVRTDLPYDPLKQLTFIARVARAEALYVVRNDLSVKSVSDLVAYAKANPGKLNYGSAGVGSSNHLLAEQLKILTDTDMQHVPYKSDMEVARELVAGRIDFGMAVTPFSGPFVKEGRIRAIAITGNQRLQSLPDIPTLDEVGVAALKGLGPYLYYGLVGPANMPDDVVRTLNDAFNEVAALPDFRQKMETLYFQPITGTPEAFRQLVTSDLAQWKEIGKTVKITTY